MNSSRRKNVSSASSCKVTSAGDNAAKHALQGFFDCLPVDTCARIISRAIETGRRDVVMTLKLNLAAKLYPFVPDLVDARVVRSTRQFYAR